jgi:hypothetical protein
MIRKLMPFNTVAANTTATVEIEKGLTVHAIELRFAATGEEANFDKTHFSRIRAKLNGKTIFEATGQELQAMNSYKKRPDTTGKLTIHFDEPEAMTLGGMMAGGIPTAKDCNSFALEVQLGDLVGSPTLYGYMICTPPLVDNTGAVLGCWDVPINAIVRTENPFSAAGGYSMGLPYGKDAGHNLKRFFMFHSNLTHVELKRNGYTVVDEIPVADLGNIAADYNNAPQSGLCALDLVYNGNMAEAMDTLSAQTVVLKATVSQADTIKMLTDLYGLLKNM